jgi:crotonobetaine/carnitine-CoA ligase
MNRELYGACISCRLEAAAAALPDKVSINFEGSTLTFADLHRRSLLGAARLRAAGIQRGDIVVAASYNSLDYVVLFFSCLAAGVVWAPLNVALTDSEVVEHVRHLDPAAVLTSAEFGAHGSRVHAELGVPTASIEAIVAAGDGTGPLTAHEHVTGADTAWIIFSGATTGRPKAIELPASWSVASAQRAMDAIELAESDIFYSVLQMYHAWQSLHVLVAGVTVRCTVAMRRWFSASQWIAEARRVGATIVDPLAPMISAILAQPEQPSDADNRIRMSINAVTDGTPRSIANRVAYHERFGLSSVNIYGLTEAGALVAFDIQHGSEPDLGMRPSADYEVVVADPEGWPCEPGVIGEIHVRPRFPGLISKGYRSDAGRTVNAWRDLWIHTGDRAVFQPDGELRFVGRDAFWIRRRGENLSAIEVEDVLRDFPGVADVAVVGIEGELGEQDVMAFVERVSAEDFDLEKLHTFVRTRLAYFKVPRYYEVVEALPRTAKGDVMRHKLARNDDRVWDAGVAHTPSGARHAAQARGSTR